jgi:lysophospholipase L1-like esterase
VYPEVGIYPKVMSDLMGWSDHYVSPWGGCGYIASYPVPGNDFASLLQTEVLDRGPSVVVLQGGVNDPKDAGTIAAIGALLARLSCTVYVVGLWSPHDATAGEIAFDADMAAVVRAAGVRYISILGWITDANKGVYIDDGVHPTPAGAAYFGSRLAAELGVTRLAGIVTEAGAGLMLEAVA